MRVSRENGDKGLRRGPSGCLIVGMNEPHVAPPQGGGPRYSPDGRWQWDGQRWTPVADTGPPAIIQPPRDLAPAPFPAAPVAGSGPVGLALGLGIGAIVAGGVVWLLSFALPIRLALALILVIGFVAGVLAIVLALAPATRPRGSGRVAALTCGLIGLGILLLFTGLSVLAYP